MAIQAHVLASQLLSKSKNAFSHIKLAANFLFYSKTIVTVWCNSGFNIQIFSVGICNKSHAEDKRD